MSKNILIAAASSGWGHIQAARNIASAIEDVRPTIMIRGVDAFECLPFRLGALFNHGWQLASRRSEALYAQFYSKLVRSSYSRGLLDLLIGQAADRMAIQFMDFQPDAFIATHSFAASVGSRLKERFGFKLIVVATDFVLHSMQIQRNVDFLCVPPAYERTFGEKELDHHPATILDTGIPISQGFATSRDAQSIRDRLQLSPDLLTVLVSFGGSGLRAERHVRVFENLLSVGLPIQFIVLAGHNEHFSRTLRSCSRRNWEHRIKVFDFVDDVADFYSVADVFIGKAGGLSISEAMVAGLPIVVIDSLPGQEESNLRMLLSHELGIHVRHTGELIDTLKLIINRITQFGRGRSAHEFARPLSSQNIAACVASVF